MEPSSKRPVDRPPCPPPRSASRTTENSPQRRPPISPPPLDSTSLDDIEVDDLGILEEDLPVPPAKHFLDYDSQPPPEFEDIVIGPGSISAPAVPPKISTKTPPTQGDGNELDEDDDVDISSTVAVKGLPPPNNHILYPGEVRKVDKKFETDGEISDFELAKYSQTMRTRRAEKVANQEDPMFLGAIRKKKHFLDENPIPPEGDFEREHRSLDRNYERAKELDPANTMNTERPTMNRRKDTTSFALARFLEQDSIGPSSLPHPTVHRGTWPADRPNDTQFGHLSGGVSMPGSHAGEGSSDESRPQKVECVYSLLSMLGCSDQVKMSRKFLELSRSPDTCVSLRHSRCIPLIVQIIHSDADEQTRKDARTALHNVVNCHPDDKAGRREAKVLRHIEHVLEYSESLKQMLCDGEALADDRDRHPLQAMSSLMKISFDEEHRHAMCQLGALQAIASVVQLDHAMHGNVSVDDRCASLRRYSAMALTNLTFGDGYNKAALCANKDFMRAFVAQLNSNVDELLPVTANVLRNLSWRADKTMKQVLNEIGTVTALTTAVMRNQNESTIKALLSALWNLSAHCSTNKAELCAVDGALAFLVEMLTYEGPSKTLTIIENAGGILSNISSHIAVNESYRAILRQRNCLGILLQQLSSESLTIVSNACGTLWNLSARCAQDQQYLLDNNAVRRLSLLLSSKHKMISNGSSAALKNLMNFQPSAINHNHLDPVAKAMRLKELPTLNVRKQRAFEQALDQNLGETCDNIDVTTPPKDSHKSMEEFLKFNPKGLQIQAQRLTKSANNAIPRSDSKDSIVSVVRTQHTSRSSPPTPRRSKPSGSTTGPTLVTSGVYQETDIDQITDFSLRYGELVPSAIIPDYYTDSDEAAVAANTASKAPTKPAQVPSDGAPITLDDTVKCYETEGTPYVISNAASVTDLTRGIKTMTVIDERKPKSGRQLGASGINTPERCTNYCEEGTPGVYDSYSSLDEADETLQDEEECKIEVESVVPEPQEEEVPVAYRQEEEEDVEKERDQVIEVHTPAPTTPGGPKAVTFETPMMFSRHSSMESLSSIEPALVMDDRSSVISDFSRLASGIISPSEIPDSPSQMVQANASGSTVAFFPSTPPKQFQPQSTHPQQPLRSVFEDDVNAFGVENTPAHFSCATSLSNLSLDDEPKIASDSKTKEQKENLEEKKASSISDDSDDDANDVDTDLLATCINIGMNKIPAIDPVKPDLIPKHDDSTSGSDMADESLLEQCIQVGIQRAVKPKPPPKMSNQPPIPGPKPQKPKHDSSLSSLSMEDSEDDGAILQKAIAAGSQKMIKPTAVKPTQNFQSNQADDSFSSVDSIDSGDTQNANSILEQCIQTGMKKLPLPVLPSKPRIPERTSKLPSFKTPTQSERERQRERERKDEALLMECIQTGMASKTARSIPMPSSVYTSNLRRDQLLSAHQTNSSNSFAHPHHQPKNVQTTSVAATPDTHHGVQCTVAPDVDETTHCHPHPIQTQTSTTIPTNPANQITIIDVKNELKSDKLSCHTLQQSLPAIPLQGHHTIPTTGSSSKLDQSLASICDLSQVLDRSNEYPAMMMGSNGTYHGDDSPKMEESATTMEQSNEFLQDDRDASEMNDEMITPQEEYDELSQISEELFTIEQTRSSTVMMDKHKDPDLMMQSVERLTQELMTTAEMLRTASNSAAEPSIYDKQRKPSWNDDNCPTYDASFPSNSWTTPRIADVNAEDDDEDATLSKDPPRPTSSGLSFILGSSELDADDIIQGTSQPDSLDTETVTLVAPHSEIDSAHIRFQVGGPTFRDHRLHPATTSVTAATSTFHLSSAAPSTNGCSFSTTTNNTTCSSNMTNSTIIALEANKVASDLLNMQSMTDSLNSLDLDAIRPPSAMDTVSGYFEPSITSGGHQHHHPLFSPQLARRKKSLPAGLMAKRALSQFTNGNGMVGSLESVHSSCNLENVKPPSIMDDLMDSMISVASITSEVASPDHSRYDTAVSQLLTHDDHRDDDDDTTTLRSCYDLPTDPDQATPVASDFSSAESTPRKQRCVRRALTAKQKRMAAKERYRTYTIAADMMLMDSDDCGPRSDDSGPPVMMKVKNNDDNETTITGNMVEIEIVEDEGNKLMMNTSRQRRSNDRNRFQTQIIDPKHFAELSSPEPRNRLQTTSSQEDDNDIGFANSRPPTAFNRFSNHIIDTTSSGSNSLDDDADMSSIRALNERFRFITEELPATAPSPTYNGLPTVAQKLAQLNRQRLESTIVDTFNSLDFEQSSETESCNQNNCVDEETYNVPEEVIQKPSIVKPKIIKPNELSAKSIEDIHDSNESEVKAVRGKKKAAYVSPYRKSSSNSPPAKKVIANTTTPSPPKRAISKLLTPRTSPANNIVTKTHVLTNKSSLTTKSGLTRPGFSSSPKTNAKTPTKTSSPKKLALPSPPERQGTFVKEEPTLVDAPIVHTSAPSTPAKTSRIPSKLPSSIPTSSSPAKSQSTTSIARIKNPLQRSATVSNTTKISSPKTSPRSTVPGTSPTDPKRRQNTPSSGIGFFRSPSTPSVPMRSHSNASLKSNGTTPTSSQPPSRSNSNLSKTGSVITSRIAGIWKKQPVDQKSNGTKNAAAPVAKPPRLIRSSTFNNTPEEDPAQVEAIKMRSNPVEVDATKRVSRLGTFINVEETAA